MKYQKFEASFMFEDELYYMQFAVNPESNIDDVWQELKETYKFSFLDYNWKAEEHADHLGQMFKLYNYVIVKCDEVWADVEGYEGIYQVSSKGLVKSLSRKRIKLNKDKVDVKNKYRGVTFRKNGLKRQFHVHRIVSKAFIYNRNLKRTVNHKNGIKGDNSIFNLEWCTYSENTNHALNTGLRIPKSGDFHYKTSLNENQVIRIKRLLGEMSVKNIAKKYSVSVYVIYDIRSGRTWSHVQLPKPEAA